MALHSCCAPCSAAIIEHLLGAGEKPLVYFYNPNIFPETEYLHRKSELVRYTNAVGVAFVDGDYENDIWLEQVRHLAGEPERGARCLECFKIRMLATAKLAKQLNIPVFATTLAASPRKSLEQIAQAGYWAAAQCEGVEFLEKNWRKGGLNERRIEIVNQYNFYRQKYCGCRMKS